MGALDSFLNEEEHKSDTKDSETIKTPLTKEQEESLIRTELRNTNNILRTIEGHLSWIALAAVLSIAMAVISILWILSNVF